MSHDFIWLPHDTRSPYVSELIRHERVGNEGIMEFNGYFYIEDESCPVERILCYNNGFLEDAYHIEIYEKKTGRDTSYDGQEEGGDEDDEFGGRICFFPTAIIRLKYRVLEKIRGAEEMKCIHENILEQQGEFEKRDMQFRAERSRREMKEAAEIGRKIDYKAWFAKLEREKEEGKGNKVCDSEEDIF